MSSKLAVKLRGMDWFRGLRAATAVSLPLLVGGLLVQPELAWCALGGFEATLADSGGPYRTRIRSLALLTFGGAAGCLLGSLVGGNMEWALPVTLIFCFAWSYTLVLGSPFASAAPLIQVIYFCGLGAPTSSLHVASVHAGLLLVGGLWAMVLSLFLWPLDAYRPARLAVGDCYAELASFLKGARDLNQRGRVRGALWHRLARHHQSRIRTQIEKARVSIASVRAGRTAESIRGRNLVVLLESADVLIGHCVAIAEYMEEIAGKPSSACVERGKASLLALSEAHTWAANTLLRRMPPGLEAAALEVQASVARIPSDMVRCLETTDSAGRFLLYQVSEIAQNLEVVCECVLAVRTGHELDTAAADQRREQSAKGADAGPVALPAASWLEPLRTNFHTDSVLLRHAARIAMVCGIDVFILYRFHISYGYWMPLTSLIVLQPHVGGTFRRSLQRMGGTIAGGVLAALLAVLLQSQVLTAVAVFPLALLAVGLIPVSYSLFTFFLTPTFVLVSLPRFGDWQLAGIRTVDTVLGAVLAMLAMALLWPAWEHKRFGVQVARSLHADTRYLEALILLLREDTQRTGAAAASGWRAGHDRLRKAVVQARRGAGLAHNDTEDSLDRLVLEPSIPGLTSGKPPARASELAMALVAYLRRVAQSITTLASLPPDDRWRESATVQQRLAAVLTSLRTLELAIQGDVERLTPAGDSQLKGASADYDLAAAQHRGDRQLTRLERQVDVLRRLLQGLQNAGLLRSHGASDAG